MARKTKKSVDANIAFRQEGIKNTVVFRPFIGKDYNAKGRKLLGRRVMVVGASHYCKDHFKVETGCSEKCRGYGKRRQPDSNKVWNFGRRCERFTQVVYECYRKYGGEYWFGTFTRFYNSFFDGDGEGPSHSDRIKLLDHMVCTEYMQGVEGGGPHSNDDAEMAADRNFIELEKVVAEQKPDVIIFWGPRVWKEVCRHCKTDDSGPDIQFTKIGGRQVKIVRTPHPSAYGKRGFDRKHFQDQLKEVDVKLVEKGS